MREVRDEEGGVEDGRIGVQAGGDGGGVRGGELVGVAGVALLGPRRGPNERSERVPGEGGGRDGG